jgi:hypothetical protein
MLSPSRFDPMESPERTETASFSREELVAQYYPMSEDSDDRVGYHMIQCNDSPHHISMTRFDQVISSSTSPVSPQRNQRTINGVGRQFGCSSFTSSTGDGSSSLVYMTSFPLPCTQPRKWNIDSESRFPPSPSDPCQYAYQHREVLKILGRNPSVQKNARDLGTVIGFDKKSCKSNTVRLFIRNNSN